MFFKNQLIKFELLTQSIMCALVTPGNRPARPQGLTLKVWSVVLDNPHLNTSKIYTIIGFIVKIFPFYLLSIINYRKEGYIYDAALFPWIV